MEKFEQVLETKQVIGGPFLYDRKEDKLIKLWNVFKKDKLAVIGLFIILMAAAVSLLAPFIAPYDPNVSHGSKRLLGIGTAGHILGVDEQGRDILSRLIWGGRTSLLTAVLPITLMFSLSLMLGLLAGYWGGKTGEVIMRFLDVLFAFPTVLLAIVVSAIMGAGVLTIMVSCCLTMLPYMTRVVYTSTVTEKTKEYIEAARILGANKLQIAFKEILPNVFSDLIVYSTTLIGVAMVLGAGLSFLGLGVQPPTADWGKMTSDGMKVLTLGAPHVATIPGLIILIVATAFNWVGDGLRDLFDPHKRTQ
ncbi:ABC transporter permease [Fictibacillus sp. S7]|uniref:ABC transporter permease n=1 Tax=Fictibacillus sp. S7 TaxID=2212476 RepID=UPI00101185D0|nr:ABC transporter permease [Fictibacillus sp. S7]RXZ02191.1 ABC transporter permease [Fictibacillus sp. S7]